MEPGQPELAIPVNAAVGVAFVRLTVRLVSVLPVSVIMLFELPNVRAVAEARGAPVRLKLPTTSKVPFAGRVASVLGTVRVNWPEAPMFRSPEVRVSEPMTASEASPVKVTPAALLIVRLLYGMPAPVCAAEPL